MKRDKRIIGKDDIADFPAFKLKDVPVKIDSGAYTSTIHCSNIIEEEGKLKVIFLEHRQSGFTGEVFVFDKFQVKKVRSSNGEEQDRYKVVGTINLFGKTYKTEFTLSQRKKMRYPVLLGRKLLNNKFLIDTALSKVSYDNSNNIL
ncbi:MAG: ATP-dependent zinc protease [Crocinitomicaceae bacterium]|nr:ATP-dependent zinc protease [Crocinitomicaceae bacterium]